MTKTLVAVASALALLASASLGHAAPADPAAKVDTPALDAATAEALKGLYKRLIDAEDAHDLQAVRSMMAASPVSLFISRVEPVAKGDWGAYWGTDAVMQHFHDLYAGTFRIDPDYTQEKVVGLAPNVAESAVAAGQNPMPVATVNCA